MALKKEKTKEQEVSEKAGRLLHAWHPDATWSDADYKARTAEFQQIHREYQECLETWRMDKTGSLHADVMWHIRKGTMNPNGAVVWNDVAQENNEWQPYQINQFKLWRYFKWRLANMTEEERAYEQGLSRKIIHSIRQELIALVQKSKVTT